MPNKLKERGKSFELSESSAQREIKNFLIRILA